MGLAGRATPWSGETPSASASPNPRRCEEAHPRASRPSDRTRLATSTRCHRPCAARRLGKRWPAVSVPREAPCQRGATTGARLILPRYCPGIPIERENPRKSGGFRVRDTGIEPVTSSVSGKRATAAPIAPVKAIQLRSGGGDGIRTRVNGFAGRCLAARPRHRVWFDPTCRDRLSDFSGGDPRTRADDETRTRDPHLGKVMRYQLRYIRMTRIAPGT